MEKTYCEHCNKDVLYNKQTEIINETVCNIDVKYESVKTHCVECGNEVLIENYDDENTRKANQIYRNKMAIISVDELSQLLEKYDIDATILSQILGWGQITITRYLTGQTPSKRYSDILYDLFHNPNRLYNLLKENEQDMPSVAYKKCLRAMKNYM